MTHTLITGGTGLVGSQVAQRLNQVWITTRDPTRAAEKNNQSGNFLQWAAPEGELELSSIPNLRCVINLMGESVAEGRWTQEKKKRIRDSRVIGTKRLIEGMAKLNQKPEVLVSASAVGLYGDHGDDVITEKSPAGEGFLSDVCREWEQASMSAADLGVRVVLLRIGIVMSADGGALTEMLPIFKKGLGGRIGSGKQFFPWIHIQDLVELILWSMHNQEISGPVNATAPNPVTNAEFTNALADALNRPAVLPAPKFALKMMLGEFAETLFDSQRVVPDVANANGFRFKFNTIQQAFSDLFPQSTE